MTPHQREVVIHLFCFFNISYNPRTQLKSCLSSLIFYPETRCTSCPTSFPAQVPARSRGGKPRRRWFHQERSDVRQKARRLTEGKQQRHVSWVFLSPEELCCAHTRRPRRMLLLPLVPRHTKRKQAATASASLYVRWHITSYK